MQNDNGKISKKKTKTRLCHEGRASKTMNEWNKLRQKGDRKTDMTEENERIKTATRTEQRSKKTEKRPGQWVQKTER